jgi:hypothetical protein
LHVDGDLFELTYQTTQCHNSEDHNVKVTMASRNCYIPIVTYLQMSQSHCAELYTQSVYLTNIYKLNHRILQGADELKNKFKKLI